MRIFFEKNEKKSLFFIQKHTNKYHFFPKNKPTYCFFYVSKIQIENLNCWKKITLIQIWHKFWILKFFTFSEQKKLNLNSVVEILFIFLVNLFFSVSEFVRFEKKNRVQNYKKPLQTILHRTIINYSFIFSRKHFVTFVQLSKYYFLFSRDLRKKIIWILFWWILQKKRSKSWGWDQKMWDVEYQPNWDFFCCCGYTLETEFVTCKDVKT